MLEEEELCPFQSSKRKQIFPDLGYFKAGWPLSLIHLIKSNINHLINVRITRTWMPFDNCNFPFSATLISLWSDSNLSLESKVAALAYYYPHVQGAPIPFNNHVPTPHPHHLHQPPHSSEPFSNQGHILIHESHPDRCQLHRKYSEVAFRKHTGGDISSVKESEKEHCVGWFALHQALAYT